MTEIYSNFIWRTWKILIFRKFIFRKNFKFQDHCMYLGRKEEPENVLRKKKILAVITSVTQLYPSLCDPMDCSTQDLPVRHQLPEFTQPHVH